MKKLIVVLFAGLFLVRTTALAQSPKPVFDETFQFIYFSVLEGLYLDGVSDTDVQAMLQQTDKGQYMNFVYSCPVCMPALNAILAYSNRPALYGYKAPPHNLKEKTFGPGISDEISKQLHSPKTADHLAAIHNLMGRWMSARMDRMNLSSKQRSQLIKQLEEARKKGAEAMRRFAENGDLSVMAPAYAMGDECAICNAAAQMPLKLKDRP